MIQIDIPIPTSCWCCPFSGRFDNFRNYCKWFPTSEMVTDTAPRPEWCPLRDVKIMNDLISRQAAIDAADRADYPGLAVEAVKAVTDEVIKELKKLTSTDAVEVVRCKDCKHYQFADNRAFGFPVKRCEWTGFEDVDYDDFCSRGER